MRLLKNNNKGNALLLILLLMVVTGSIIGIVVNQTSSMAANANRARQYQAAQSAASGALEYAYSVWLRKVAAKHDLLSSASDLYLSGTTPSFSGSNALYAGTSGTIELKYSSPLKLQALDKYGRALASGTTPDPIINAVPSSAYSGWWGRTYTYAATVQVSTTDGQVKAGARRLFYYTETPLFQCMYFFQDNLEIINPAKMTLNGLIHTNKNLYLSCASPSTTLTINGLTTYSGTYGNKDPYGTGYTNLSGQVAPYFSTSNPTQVTTISAMGDDFDVLFANAGTNPNLTGTYHELIEPPDITGTDPGALSDRRLYNIAANSNDQTADTGGLIIQVTGTSITANTIIFTTLDSTSHLPVATSGSGVYTYVAVGQNAAVSDTAGFVKALVSATTPAISKKLGKSGSSAISGTAHFYDGRDGSTENVVDINLYNLQNAISNYVTSFSNIIYLYDTTPKTVSGTNSGATNTVRLVSGSSILSDDGLTIASLNPVYIQGDFNTGGTRNAVQSNSSTATSASNSATSYTVKPTSIISDAITLLSSAWTDSSTQNGSMITAANTTYNVALLGGYVPSTSTAYSGGANNYPRYIENWNNKTCTYYGSMVELFPSQYQTDGWSTSYYSPPIRLFNFDTQFSSKSPPGCVYGVILNRGLWSPWSP